VSIVTRFRTISIPRRFRLAAVAGLLLFATATFAQPPAPPPTRTGPMNELPLGPTLVSPDSLRRLADQLKLLKGANIDPKLIQEILKLKALNPNLSNEQLAERFRDYEALKDPKQREALEELVRLFGAQPEGMVPPGVGGNIPAQPNQPPSIPPMTPPGMRPGPGDISPPIPLPPMQGDRNPDRTEGMNRPMPGMRPNQPIDMEGGMPDRFTPPRPPGNSGVTGETLEQRQRQFQAVAGWWENNVGPMSETPALRQLMLEMFTGQSGSGTDTGSLGELLEGPAGEGFGKIADRFGGSRVKLPDLGIGKSLGSDSSFTPPSTPSGSSFGGLGGVNGGTGSWLPVVVLLVVAGLALVLWWLWPKLMTQGEPGPRPLPGLGPWPVDPRHIADREALVKAFEYLSVLVCGGGARTWNHFTIAAALERAAPHAEALAEPLARLYEVARYTPANEPLPPGAIVEAREYLCELAGVSAA